MFQKNTVALLKYISIILFFIILGIFFRQSFFALMIIILSILPVISIFILKYAANRIAIKIDKITSSVLKNNEIKLNIKLINQSIFSILNCNIHYSFQNIYYPHDSNNLISLPALSKQESKVVIPFETSKLGMDEFIFDYFEITDFLHLYSIRRKINYYFQIPVMPEKKTENYIFPEACFYNEEDDEDFSNYGQITTDLKDTREYIPGDPLKNIHWKLSAKNQYLTVKLFEQSSGKSIIILAELNSEMLDETINNLYSYSHFLLNLGESFKICIFSALNKDFDFINIESESDLDNGILKLYFNPIYEMKKIAYKSFIEQYGNSMSFIYILGNNISLINSLVSNNIFLKENEISNE